MNLLFFPVEYASNSATLLAEKVETPATGCAALRTHDAVRVGPWVPIMTMLYRGAASSGIRTALNDAYPPEN